MAIDKNPRQITRLRVEDQKKLEELATELTYNSTTNTFEIGSNLEVNGNLKVANDINILKFSYLIFEINTETDESFKIFYDDSFNEKLRVSYNNPDGDEYSQYFNGKRTGDIVTDDSLKTLFGKSILKEPENNNIDLYKHYLHIQGGASGAGLYDFYIVIQSSSNVDCSSTSGATKKLRNLLKVSPATPRMYETGVCGPVKMPEGTENYSAERPCALYWDGSMLYARNGVADFEITLIEDRVETL